MKLKGKSLLLALDLHLNKYPEDILLSYNEIANKMMCIIDRDIDIIELKEIYENKFLDIETEDKLLIYKHYLNEQK